MRSICILILSFFSISGFCADYCQQRQILEGKIKLAKEFNINSSKVKFTGYKNGFWTQTTSGSIGSDLVTVSFESWTRTYYVAAKKKQNNDCQITQIKLFENL